MLFVEGHKFKIAWTDASRRESKSLLLPPLDRGMLGQEMGFCSAVPVPGDLRKH
jgi:hypothetical protein